MNKDINQIRELIESCIQNKRYRESDAALTALLRDKTNHPIIRQVLQEILERGGELNDPKRQQDVFDRIDAEIQSQQIKKPKRFRLAKFFAMAAVLLAIFAVSIIIYKNRHQNEFQDLATEIAKANIRPGRKTATLTLTNGKQIALDDHGFGEIAREHGFSIQKNADGALTYTVIKDASKNKLAGTNTLSTANGQTIKVVLPDGTKVWLNAASSITYPSSFAAAQRREVRLIGEAYFEVATDKLHPFIVNSTDQDVEVLGTHFNINGYLDKNTTYTTLLEGKIKIGHNGIFSFLNPKQQAQNTSGKFKIINNVDVADVVAWKDGYFVFSDSLQSIMDKVAKWYDVKVVYENEPDLTTELQGKISRQKDLNEVLQLLEKYSGGVKFQVKGKTIIVKH